LLISQTSKKIDAQIKILQNENTELKENLSHYTKRFQESDAKRKDLNEQTMDLNESLMKQKRNYDVLLETKLELEAETAKQKVKIDEFEKDIEENQRAKKKADRTIEDLRYEISILKAEKVLILVKMVKLIF